MSSRICRDGLFIKYTLGGIALGLESYHIFELKDEIPDDAWAAEMTFEEMEAGDELIEKICQTMREVRGA